MGEMKMQRDEKEKYTIAVAGMGYVGLSIATLLAQHYIGIFRESLLHDGRSFQMILVASGESVFDCYMQGVFIQTGLLKSIKYLMFDVFALNGIVNEWIERKNISGADFMSFASGSFE